MKHQKFLTLFLAIFIAGVAFAAAPQQSSFTLNPKMHCADCENKIKSNMRFEKGVKKIETSIENQIVTISYDANKTSEEKLIKAFKKLGYDAQVADSNAKKECDDAHKGCSGKCEKQEKKSCCSKENQQCEKKK